MTSHRDAAPRAEAGFVRRDGWLHADAVALADIAGFAGTPAYVYSASVVRAQYARLDAALEGVPHRLHYSVKANGNLALLALLRELGAGVDIVSAGELYRAQRAGFGGRDVVFSGVGKTVTELEQAVAADVKLVNVESEAELRLLADVARRVGRVVPVALRVNPEVEVETAHHYTRTGARGDKFGIPYDEAREVARLASSLEGIRLAGLDMHIGSQLTRIEPYADGLARLLELRANIDADGGGEGLRYLDIGGGLGVTYDAESEADLDAFARIVVPAAKASGLELVMEPGRFLVGNAGVLLTRVLYRKRSGGKDYVITDAGMTELLRPSHYNAFHRIEPIGPAGEAGVVDVVGPVCESGDFFARDRSLGDVEPGDLLAISSAGAYGAVMSSQYNARPRVPEILVDGERVALARERESFEDLVRHENATPEWRTL
ncbi:MAG: diaminopimelate decarboxylase [Gemmatimonadaceae bacterium]|nr:diaminopimelate decarboxylase [Gemmatimonadaceae bacterium]